MSTPEHHMYLVTRTRHDVQFVVVASQIRAYNLLTWIDSIRSALIHHCSGDHGLATKQADARHRLVPRKTSGIDKYQPPTCRSGLADCKGPNLFIAILPVESLQCT